MNILTFTWSNTFHICHLLNLLLNAITLHETIYSIFASIKFVIKCHHFYMEQHIPFWLIYVKKKENNYSVKIHAIC